MIVIKEKEKCCGCGACGDICPKSAISFNSDKEGFWYPVVDLEKCVDCGLCEKICPFVNPRQSRKPISCFAAINPNEEEREKSSSGGIFSLLMKQTLIEGGIVFGAVFDKDWMVHHIYVENFEDAKLFRGSKYVQSNLEGNYKNVQRFLKQGRKVLFSGTACQIAALNNFLGKEFDNLLTVDVVCHGVPSPGVWKEYLNYLRRPEGAGIEKNTVLSSLNDTPPIEGISFRDKKNGWKKFGFVVRYSTDHRTVEKFGLSSLSILEKREPFSDNLFMQGFLKNLYLRPSCYNCKVKSGGCHSDLTLGDFWGVWNELPEIDDDKGVSLLLINSQKGETFINSVKPLVWPVDYNQGLKYNPCLEESVCATKWRDVFMEEFCEKRNIFVISDIIKKMRPPFYKRVLRRIKSYLHN